MHEYIRADGTGAKKIPKLDGQQTLSKDLWLMLHISNQVSTLLQNGPNFPHPL